jgi:hypothetical protein
MLVASHLPLIVGKAQWKKHKTMLYPLIEAERDLSSMLNVLWVTNRQQGKTTTLGRFAAALALTAPEGGDNMLFIYSTTLNRAQALGLDAKEYIIWIQQDPEVQAKLKAIGLNHMPRSVPSPPFSPGAKPFSSSRTPVCRFVVNNSERFSVTTMDGGGSVNMIWCRPKTAKSCRGDAPKAAILDEVAFVDKDFWEKFALPLLAVTNRVFTLATTPAKLNSFFDVFVKKQEKLNREKKFFFRLVNHSLMCDECFERDMDHCSHKLYLVPPWKSILRIEGIYHPLFLCVL